MTVSAARTAHLHAYLNYHRPCGFAVIELGAHGKKKRIYRTKAYPTPYEKLTSLPHWQQYLKAGQRPAAVQQQPRQMSDIEAARRMKKAKLSLLEKCRGKSLGSQPHTEPIPSRAHHGADAQVLITRCL